MLSSYTIEQSAGPNRNPTCWTSPGKSYTVTCMSYFGAWTPAPHCTIELRASLCAYCARTARFHWRQCSSLVVVKCVTRCERGAASGETSTLGQGGKIAVVGARVKTVKYMASSCSFSLGTTFLQHSFPTTNQVTTKSKTTSAVLRSCEVFWLNKQKKNGQFMWHSEPSHL